MNVIPLKPTQAVSSRGTVKTVALATFRFLRAGSAQAHKLPGLVKQASIDIRDAWAESRPNV